MAHSQDLSQTLLDTERQDERLANLDQLDVQELVTVMNQADAEVAQAVAAASDSISQAISAISEQYQLGGRIVYVGAGTSGRLATLDASEIYPTFGVSGRVIALMAGGRDALVDPKEGAEDNEQAAVEGLKALGLTSLDAVVGVASSGSTPFVMSALEYSNQLGAVTVAISCNAQTRMSEIAKFPVEVVVGPEVITGSTRLKAGTAQKMILNMISTITMVKAGKTFGNLMVDVVASNTKLKNRAIAMVCVIADIDPDVARDLLEKHDWNVKSAVLGANLNLEKTAALALLDKHDGVLAAALGSKQ